MSAQERSQYDVAFRESRPSMTFDPDSRLSADERIQISELLNYLAARSTPHPRSRAGDHAFDRQRRRSRELRMSEAAALRSNLIDIRGTAAANELLREIAWSTEKGALAKYPVPKAIAIGLKKVRENAWTRPNRMPPNWWPAVGSPSYAAAHGK